LRLPRQGSLHFAEAFSGRDRFPLVRTGIMIEDFSPVVRTDLYLPVPADNHNMLNKYGMDLPLQQTPRSSPEIEDEDLNNLDLDDLFPQADPLYNDVFLLNVEDVTGEPVKQNTVRRPPQHSQQPTRSTAVKHQPLRRAVIRAEETSSPGPIRRGRPMRITSDSKQAMYAREYRDKNKRVLADLERRVAELESENSRLAAEKQQMAVQTSKLRRDKQYLRQVLENQSALAPLLSQISNQNGCASDKLQFVKARNGSGVCVHLAGERISVEVCEQCNAQNRERSVSSLSSFGKNGITNVTAPENWEALLRVVQW